VVAERDAHASIGVDALIKAIGKGRHLPEEASEALERLFGCPVGLEGLSRLFQPGFPGVRAFVVEPRVSPDQAVEVTIVGIARSGAPVWTTARAFVRGRDGWLEIHHGYNEIDPAYRSRNITTDLMQRELDILALLQQGPASRITIDAEDIGSYVCALHGYVFADETEEGPPVRSARALDSSQDRARMIAAAPPIIERIAQKHGLGKSAIDNACADLSCAEAPWDLLRLTLPGMKPERAEGDDGELGVGALGRELLLSKDLPGWRAALYLEGHHEARALGDEYRKRKTARSMARLAIELQEARDQLQSQKRETKMKALKTLGMIGPSWVLPDMKALEDGRERRLAAIARQTARQISGADLPDQLIAFAENPKNDGRLRGLAYRVLAEHFRARIQGRVAMLRVNPDARIQRAVVPLVADDDATEAGPQLASLLVANPAHEGREDRPGLLALRIELIERLARLRDPRTLPALMAAYRARPAPAPAEMLALSRALVAFPDPRAQLALSEVARRLNRPAIP
jgi:hypothetical protein